jgi:mono/diheme cytochrome c family protein/uncharacterized membrane protein
LGVAAAQAPQAGSSQVLRRPAADAESGRPLFEKHCAKCHGKDGTGKQARGLHSKIPDFTDAAWQRRQEDTQLLASILDGKGPDMPPWRGKINEDQARAVVAYIRTIAPTSKSTKHEELNNPSSKSFEENQRRLTKRLHELQKQYRELSKTSTEPAPSKPSKSQQRSSRAAPSEDRQRAPSAGTASRAPRVEIEQLFRQHCTKCHGADGTGSPGRRRQPKIPDFTDTAWQARRSDAQLLASILDGKEKAMPAWRDKISTEQAQGLATYVRQFALSTESPGQEQPSDMSKEESIVEPPAGFSEKLIAWLGKFHPAVVHFPVALLTAAGLAELLRMITGKLAFDPVSRYCAWFGFLTAMLAAALGWFAAGFQLSDTSWVLSTHRWLGTSTAAGAAVVLLVSELSRRPEARRSLMLFRVAVLCMPVLVLATGFFGGALVFGLDHYSF